MTEPDISTTSMMEDHITEAAPAAPKQSRRTFTPESLGGMTAKSFQAMEHSLSQEVFPIIPNHEAFGREYCPMCGTEVDQNGDPTHDGTHDTTTTGGATAVIAFFMELAVKDARLPGLLLLKTANPNLSVRQLAPRIKLGKSQVADLTEKLAAHSKDLRRIAYGNSTGHHDAQAGRRQRERKRGVFYTGARS